MSVLGMFYEEEFWAIRYKSEFYGSKFTIHCTGLGRRAYLEATGVKLTSGNSVQPTYLGVRMSPEMVAKIAKSTSIAGKRPTADCQAEREALLIPFKAAVLQFLLKEYPTIQAAIEGIRAYRADIPNSSYCNSHNGPVDMLARKACVFVPVFNPVFTPVAIPVAIPVPVSVATPVANMLTPAMAYALAMVLSAGFRVDAGGISVCLSPSAPSAPSAPSSSAPSAQSTTEAPCLRL